MIEIGPNLTEVIKMALFIAPAMAGGYWLCKFVERLWDS